MSIEYVENGGFSFVDAQGGRTSYRLTDFLKPGRLTDASGYVTRVKYDAAGNLRTISATDGTSHSITYDGRGLPLVRTNARNQIATSTYTPRGELLQQTLSTGAITALRTTSTATC